MDALSSAVIAHTLRRDPPRFDANGVPIPRVKMDIDCTTSGLCEFGILFEVGPQTVDLYEDEVAKAEKMVEDASEADLVVVRRDHQSHLDQSRDAAKTGGEVPDRSALPSFAYSFRRIMQREMRPFRSAKRHIEKKTATKAA